MTRSLTLAPLAALAVAMISTPSHAQWSDRLIMQGHMLNAVNSAIREWEADPSRTCQSPSIERAVMLDRGITDSLIGAAGGSGPGNWAERLGARANSRAMIPGALRSSMAVAGALMRGGCLDQAERAYEDIVLAYTGSNYQAQRELAIANMQEIRAMRRAAVASAPPNPTVVAPSQDSN